MTKLEKFSLFGFLVSLLVFLGIYFSPGEYTGMGPSPSFWIICTAILSGVIFLFYFQWYILKE